MDATVADADAKSDAEKSNKRLNDLVAVSVVILTVFLAISKVKDDNINQAMQKAQSEAVDAWAEYQAARLKLHVEENSLATLRLLETQGTINRELAEKQAAEYQSDIAKYEGRSKETMAKARSREAEYDRLNFHDDQFDISEAFISIAIAVAAVAALTDVWWLLYFAWASGTIGIVFGVAGFAGFALHPDWLAKLLGA
jgi:hypothetical protein